jgi:hypothetical protein
MASLIEVCFVEGAFNTRSANKLVNDKNNTRWPCALKQAVTDPAPVPLHEK